MKWLALVVVTLAAVIWLGVIARSHPTPAAMHVAPPDAAPPAVDAAIDASPDTVVDVAEGVRYRVPSWCKHERVDATSISIAAPAMTMVVSVRTGPRLKVLAAPIDGMLALAKDEKLRVVSITTEGPDRTLGRFEGFQVTELLYVVTRPNLRVVVFLRADGTQNSDALVDEFVHGARLVLP